VGLGAASTAVRTATSVAQWRAQRAAADRPTPPAFSDNRQQMAVFFPFPRGGQDNGPLPHYPAAPAQRPGAPGQPQLPGRPDRPQLPPGGPQGSQPPSDGTGLRRVQSRKMVGGALLRAGTHAALAYATGGTSSAVTGAAKAASAGKSARRAALATRIAIGAGRSATQPSRPAPGPRAPRLDQGRPGSAADAVIRGEVISPRPPSAGNPGKGLQPPAGKRSAPAGKPTQPRPSPQSVTSTPPVRRTPTQPSETQRSENTQRADQLRQRLLDRTRPRRSA